jgi:hypothetical protein
LTAPYSPWQNRTELEIRELKKEIRRVLASTGAPPHLWCYAGEWVAQIRSHTVHDIAALEERTPFEHFNGLTPNIALLCTFSFDDYCWFVTPVEGFPHQKKILARWLGVAHEVGGPMTYWGLTGTYKVVARSTVLPLTADELKDPLIIADMLTIGKDRTDKEVEADLGILFPADGDLLDLDEDDGFEAYEPEAAMPELTTGRPRPSISTSLLRFSCRSTASFFEDAWFGGSVAPTGIQSGRRIPTAPRYA